jgi:hypothetical protein
LAVFEDEVVVLPVSSTKTGVFEDEMGIWAVSSLKLRDFEDEVIDRAQKKARRNGAPGQLVLMERVLFGNLCLRNNDLLA